MGRHLESYVTFIKENHLPQVTKYFIKEAHCKVGEGLKKGKIKNGLLKKHFKKLLNRISDLDLLEECIKEVNQFRKKLKKHTEIYSLFSAWYLSYLNNNKDALIHFIPFYTEDLLSTMELVEEIEDVFSKLETDVLSKIGITRSSDEEDKEVVLLTQKALEQTSEKLKLREEQLLETQKIAKVGSFRWDIEQDEISGTNELRRIFNIPKGKQLSLKRFESYLGKKSKKTFRDKLITALKQSDYYELEFKIKLTNGEVKYIVIRTKSIHNENGMATHMLGIIMDISSLKKSEIQLNNKNKEIIETNKKLKHAQTKLEKTNEELDERVRIQTKEINESNERYRSFINQSSEGIWRFEFKGEGYLDIRLPQEEQVKFIFENTYFAESNDHMARLHGFDKAEDIVGRLFSDEHMSTISGRNKKDLIKSFIVAGYNSNSIIITEKDKNGKRKYIKSNVIGVIDGHKLKSAWGIQRDITERVMAVKSLKESEKRYRFLSENIPLIFWTATPQGYLDFGNRRWFDFTGAKYNGKKTLSWEHYVHPDDVSKTKSEWIASVKEGKMFQTEYRLRTAGGVYRWHLGRAVPLRDDSGEIIKWMGTSTDINYQKTYSEKLDVKNKELRRINNELDNLLFSVSHDLKAPMANIEGLVSALEASLVVECKDESIKELLNMMNNSVEKFKKSLFDTIEIAKAQKSGEDIAVENELSEVVEDVKSDLESLIGTTGATIKTDFTNCSTIKFSSKNLKSIVYNLLSNAIKYRFPGRIPDIVISSNETEEHKMLSVKDNGMGFDTRHLKDLTSNRSHKNIEGSGVGLYILKRIMDNAGGKIEVESTKGEGSKFSVFFPLNTDPDTED